MTDEHPTIKATLDYITDLIKLVKRDARACGPDYADQIVNGLRDIRTLINGIIDETNREIYARRKICNDPADPYPPICRICPNCTMAIDGAPMCALTRRGLDI